MRKFLLLAALISGTLVSNAQKYQLSVQAGGNTSFISKFDNEYKSAQRPLNPYEFLDMAEGHSVSSIGIDKTKTENRIGFFADVQIERQLRNNWGISASLGVNQVAYSYETPAFVITTDQTLKNALSKIGDVKLTYLTTRLANISKKWNRLTLTGGPELSYLVSKKYVSAVSWQTIQNEKQYLSIAGDGKGDVNKLLIGATLGLRYNVGKNFYVRLGGQKIFSSLYKKEGTHEDVYKKSRPLQAELGLGFRITGIGGRTPRIAE